MRGVSRILPNNEEVQPDTNAPPCGYAIPILDMPDTIARDIVACPVYSQLQGEATESYSLPTAGIISVEVGSLSPVRIAGSEAVLYVGTSGARLGLAAVHADAIGGWLLPISRGGDLSEDTAEVHSAFEDMLGSAIGPNIAISRAKPSESSLEAYIEWIDRPGYRSEPVVKGKGIPVWAIAAYVLDLELSYEEVVSDWEGEISADEVKAAMEYYQAHPEEIEEKRQWASSPRYDK